MLPNLQSSRPSSSRALSSQHLGGTPKRRSFANLSSFTAPSTRKLFGSTTSEQSSASGMLPVPCSATLKPRSSVELGKVSSCAAIKNPYLYPGRVAFLFTNRTEHIFLAVSSPTGKASEDFPSDTASAHSAESPTPAGGSRDLMLLETLLISLPVDRRFASSLNMISCTIGTLVEVEGHPSHWRPTSPDS